jgi:MFS family permease
MSCYAFSLIGANSFTPVISGFIAEYQGWRWVFYWPAIFFGFVFVFIFFAMEETTYIRKTVVMAVAPESDSTKSDPAVLKDSEKNPAAHSIAPAASADSGEMHHVRKPKTYWQKLAVFHYYPGQPILEHNIRSLKYLSWPVIFYAGFSYGSYLIWYNVFNNTASIVLGGAPYNFSSSMVGLSFLSAALGSLVGSCFSGPLSDWLTLKLARRNNGIMEAEHRLWPFAVCTLLVPGSLILWGVGAAHNIHWFGLVVANFLLTITLVFGAALSINYMVDSYHELMADAMVSIILVRNTMYFAVSYG